MAGPWKPPYNPGVETKHLFDFLQQLFGAGQVAFRASLFAAPNEAQLRTMLGDWGIFIPTHTGGPGTPAVRIMLVDVQNANTWQDPSLPKINPATDDFYVLVMPPVPTRYPAAAQPGYEEMQAWESAWYHAIVDGYGM
jgi:hypothetical protein